MLDRLFMRLRAHPAIPRLTFEIIRYVLVSAANAVLTFMIFFGLMKIFAINYLYSLFFSWLFGMVFSYCLSFVWVFKQPDQLAFDRRFRKFALTGMLSISFNLATLRLMVETTGYDPFWVQTGLILPVVAFNFLSAKLWSLAPVSK